MLVSVALVIIVASLLGGLFQKLNLPSLIGYLLTGIVIGPYVLDLLAPEFLVLSADIRQVALIVILMRAGLSLDLNDLRKVGRPALLMCFIPATIEIIGTIILGPILLGLNIAEALLLGSVIAAVSPAVVVPRMLKLMKEGYGTRKSIPQIILAGSSADDVFVLILFSAFLGMNQGGDFSFMQIIQVPIAIITGLFGGILAGYSLVKLFDLFKLRNTVKVVIVLSVSFLLMALETALEGSIPFSGMLSVMSVGLVIYRMRGHVANELSDKFNKIWIVAEMFLFVLVGVSVDPEFAIAAGLTPVILLIGISIFRMAGVLLSLISTDLTKKERLFTMIAYLPKATVQAAIGTIPLSMGLPSGEIILTVAVLSMIITAPIGAIGIDTTYKKLLSQDVN